MNIFEKATKTKLRFYSVTGALSVEDLWGLPLQSKSKNKANLDDIAKDVARKLKTAEEESFVNKTASSPTNELRLEILKHIIDARLEDAEKKEQSERNRLRKQKLIDAKRDIEDGAIKDMSIEEIDKEIASIDD